MLLLSRTSAGSGGASRVCRCAQGGSVPRLAVACRRFGVVLQVGHETCEQRGLVVLSPGEGKLLRQVHIDYRQQDDASRTAPTCGSKDPSHAQAGRNQTEDCRLVFSLLNDDGGLQTTTKTFAHHTIVECGGLAPRKPDKRRTR